jgi:hypothetical protein
VNFARTHLKRGGFERNDRIEPFCHVSGFKKKGLSAHGIRDGLYKKRLAKQIVVVLVLEKQFFPARDRSPVFRFLPE